MTSEQNLIISTDDLARKRIELKLRGVNITEWAAEHQFNRQMVYAVLHGRVRAYRGQANEIARNLGLIPNFDTEQAKKLEVRR